LQNQNVFQDAEQMRLVPSFAQNSLISLKLLACEAGVSIEPGAQAPGADHKNHGSEPVKTGGSVKTRGFRPLSRAGSPKYDFYLGLAPQALCFRLLRRLSDFLCKGRCKEASRVLGRSVPTNSHQQKSRNLAGVFDECHMGVG
jgi:hypothetical protein